MVKLLTLIISLLTLCDLSLSSNVDCNYDNNKYFGLNTVYTCKVKYNLNITSQDATFIESATGSHAGSNSNMDVITFDAENKKIEYFPRGLDKIFPNLKGVYIKNGRLKEIQRSDFSGLINLIYLELNDNDIAVLEDGVFDFVPDIKIIWLPDNKITHVGENAFEKLTKLQFLGIVHNTCTNVQTMEYQTESIKTLRNLKEKCFDQKFAKMSTKLKNLEDDAKNLKKENFYIFSQSLEKLENEFKSSKFSNLHSIKERFHILKFVNPESVASKNSCLDSKLDNLEGNLKSALIGSLNHNLEKIQASTCSIIDERIADYSQNLEKSFSDLYKKLKNTDKNIKDMNVKWEELINFPTAISKRMGKFECDNMQLTRKEVHDMRKINANESSKFKKLEERIGKIEENIEKILRAVNAGN